MVIYMIGNQGNAFATSSNNDESHMIAEEYIDMSNIKDHKKNDQSNDSNGSFDKIHSALDTINDCIYRLKLYQQDTNDLEVLFGILRYESFSKENVERMLAQGTYDEYLKKVNYFAELLKSLTDGLTDNSSLLNNARVEGNELESTYIKQKALHRSIINKKKKAMLLSILSSILLYLPVIKTSQLTYHHVFKAPEITEQTIDSEGQITEKKHFGSLFKSSSIEVFTPEDEAGFRTKYTYEISNLNITSSEEIEKIDLSNFEPVDKELVSSKDYPGIPSGEYRTFHKSTIDKSNRGTPEELLGGRIVLSVLLEMFLIFVLIMIRMCIFDTIDLGSSYMGEKYNEIVLINILKDLASQKIELSRLLKQIKDNNKNKAKYENIVNTISKRIDKTIVAGMEALTNLESTKKALEEQDIIKQTDEVKEEQEKLAAERKEAKNEIFNKFVALLDELSELENSKEYHHSVSITEELLFEQKDDHFVIRECFIHRLKYLNLKLIDFKNVDVRDIDFRETNAVINPQTVYNKDVSYAKFDDNNIPDWSNWAGVNRTGAIINEPEGTTVGINKSIVDNVEPGAIPGHTV